MLLEDGQVFAVVDGERKPLPVEDPVVAIHQKDDRLYVARGSRGVAIYDVSDPFEPVLVEQFPLVGSNVTSFAEMEGQVWVIATSRTAIPLVQLPRPAETSSVTADVDETPSPTAAPTIDAGTQHAQRAETSLQRVELRPVSPGQVELASGAQEGVRVGDTFLIVRSSSVAGTPTGGKFVGEQRVAFAEVVAVSPSHALAQVGRSARVAESDYARQVPREELRAHRLPPMVPNVGEVSLVLRPLIKVGTPLGGGLLADLSATYWGQSYFLGLSVQPLGLGLTKDGNVVSTAALAEGGYEAASFSVGLGLGAAWVNGNLDHMLESFRGASGYDDASSTVTVTETQQTHGAFALSQVARLGSRDALHLSLRNLLLLHDPADGDAGFIYGGTTAKLVVPVGKRTDLFGEGGGGVMGYWFCGVGTGSWLVGNGSPGSWYLSVSAGAAGVRGSREITTDYDRGGERYSYTYDEDVSVEGPMVSVGLARRFDLF